MTLNVAQYLAPLNSGQVLNGYVQGVKQGTGISISPDGTISLDPTGAASLGFITSSVIPAPVYAWPAVGAPQPSTGFLQTDGIGNLSWNTDYVSTLPVGGALPHTGAAVMPVGTNAVRPAPTTKGLLRYNDSTGAFEFSNGSTWLPMTPATGGVFSFVSNVTPTANAAGDMWLDTSTNQEKVWNGVSWIPTTPLATTVIPGRVIVGTNIQVDGTGTISVLPTTGVAGGVSNIGVTTITDNVTSIATDSALSANQGRLLQEQINALLISSNLTFAGLISGAGLMTYVTPEGALQGFALGNQLPTASATNAEYFVMVEAAGGFTPPGGVFTVVTQGDWFLSTGAAWQFLNVGYDPPYATTTVPGIIEIATDAETQTGTDATRAVTPASLSSRTATETRTGITQIATQAEANAGTNDTDIVTPLKLFTVFSSGSLDANDVLLSPVINGNLNVQSALTDALYELTSTGLTISITPNPGVGKYNLEVVQATETQLGGAEIATQVETNAGTLDNKIITPLKLAQYVAGGNIEASEIPLNPTINGYTNVQQALDTALYDIVSPSSTLSITENPTGLIDIDVVQATEGQLGGAEIATNAETQALASDSLIVTPLKLGNLFASGAIDANDILLNPLINGQTNVQDALADAIYDIVSSDNSVTIAETAVGQVDLTVTQATETQIGGAEIATQAEANAGISDATILTPLKLFGVISAGAIDANDILLNPTINGQTNVQDALEDAVYDITSTGNTLGITVTPDGNFNLNVVQATTAQLGGATLATTAEALAGTNTTDIVTPSTMRAATVYKSDFNDKGDLLTASADDTPVILPVGTDGQYLRADSTQTTGLIWDTVQASDITVSPAINGNTNLNTILQDAVYDINSANNSITITETATGINDIIVAQATETLIAGAEIATQVETETGTDDTRIVTPLKLRTAAVYKSDFNAKGDILSATADDTPSILPVGANGQVLTADSTQATGLKWTTLGAAAFYNLDDIGGSFNGAAVTFNLTIGGVAYAPTPTSNIMVFIGGVAQTPGAGGAYTITGSTITFTSAPPTGASFYATTVQ